MQNLFTSAKLDRYSLLNNFYNGTRYNLLLIKNSSFFFFFRFFLFSLKKLFLKKQIMYFLNSNMINSFFFSFFKQIPFFLNSTFFSSGLFSNQFYSKKNSSFLHVCNQLFFKSFDSKNKVKNISSNVSFISLFPLLADDKCNELSKLNGFSIGLHKQKTSNFNLLYPLLTDFFLSFNLFYYFFFLTLYNEYNYNSFLYKIKSLLFNKSVSAKKQRHYILSMKSWFFLRFFFSFFFFKKSIFKTKKSFLNVYQKGTTAKRLFFKKKYFKTTLFYKFAKAKYAFYVKKHKPYTSFKKKFKFFKKKVFICKKFGFQLDKRQPFSQRLYSWKPAPKRVIKETKKLDNTKIFKRAVRFAAVNFKF